jgi:cephalosporin hydroxylase
MNPIQQFEAERAARIEQLGQDHAFQAQSRDWLEQSMRKQYVYNFSWLGRPIIQNPIDILAMQELMWTVQPDLVIETGIAHGGSIIFSASMLELIAACGGNPDARVLGIDIDIREHNKQAIWNTRCRNASRCCKVQAWHRILLRKYMPPPKISKK